MNLETALVEILETKPAQRLRRTFQISDAMTEAEAEASFAALMQERFLMQHEADLLQILAQRLGKGVKFYHGDLAIGQQIDWKEGRKS